MDPFILQFSNFLSCSIEKDTFLLRQKSYTVSVLGWASEMNEVLTCLRRCMERVVPTEQASKCKVFLTRLGENVESCGN